jgi:hypothetical protein
MQQRGPLIYGGLLFGLSGPSEWWNSNEDKALQRTIQEVSGTEFIARS